MINRIRKKENTWIISRWFIKIFILHFISVLFFVLLSGLSTWAESPSQPNVKTGGHLIVRISSGVSSLDSQLAVSAVEKLIIRNVQEGLLDYDPNGQIVPILAASLPLPFAGDKNTWIIPLRRGIFFHNGMELVADDVVFTFRRLKNSSFPALTREVFQKLTAIEVVDKYRVKLTTDGPCPDLCDLLTRTELFPLSAKAVQRYGRDYGKVIVIGTGSFRFQSWIRDKHITLIKNWQYRDPSLPYLNSISFRFADKSFPLMKSLRYLRAHIAFQITPEEATVLKKNEWIRLYHCAGQEIVQIYLNSDVPPFDEKSIRLALAHAIDRTAFVKHVFKGFATPADSFIPPWSRVHREGYAPIEYDPEKVRFILEIEGYNFQNPLRFSLLVNEEPFFMEQARYIKDSLAEIPLFIDIVPLPKVELFDFVYGRKKAQGEFQAALESWEDLRYGRDPRQFTSELYASSSPYNKVKLSDKVLDTIFEEIYCAENFSDQQELYYTVEKRIINTVSTIYLCFPHNIHAARARVKNLRVNPLNEIDFKKVWLLK